MGNILISLMLLSVIVVSGCTSQQTTTTTIATTTTVSTIPTTTLLTTTTSTPTTTTMLGSTTTTQTQNVKEIQLTASQWQWNPSTITVNQGDFVRLKISDIDVTHGFNLPSFGINKQLTVGQVTTVEFTADKKGTFAFMCSVFCGSGHSSMTGNLVVQ